MYYNLEKNGCNASFSASDLISVSTSVSVQLLESLFDLVFFGLGINSECQVVVCAVPQLTGHRQLELQNMKFVAGRVLDEVELWSGPLGTYSYI